MTNEDFRYLYSVLPHGKFFVKLVVPDTNSCHFNVGDLIMVDSHMLNGRYFLSGTLNHRGFYPLVFISNVEPALQGNRAKAAKKALEGRQNDSK